MVSGYLHFLPTLVALWFIATFIVTYVIAWKRNDIAPVFPYISDTGTFSPESCYFGQMLNSGSILMAVLMYIRYRQVRDICERHDIISGVPRFNSYSLWVGLLAAFGISLVGNFQVSNILSVHVIGATLAFGLGSVYQCLQTAVSFRIFPAFGQRGINVVRLLLSVISCVTYFTCTLFAAISITQYTGRDMTKWKSEDGGYVYHLLSVGSEWIVALTTMIFIMSFSSDFKKIKVMEPAVMVEDNITPSNKELPTTVSVPESRY